MRKSVTVRARLLAAGVALAVLTTACGTDTDAETSPDTAVEDSASEQAPSTDNAAPDDSQTSTEGSDEAPQEVLDVLDDALAGPDADGDEGRVFGADDDIVIQAVEATFSDQNASAEWAGSTLRVTMDGSTEDIMAHIPCTAVEALLADGEDVVLVYDDGEFICADRP